MGRGPGVRRGPGGPSRVAGFAVRESFDVPVGSALPLDAGRRDGPCSVARPCEGDRVASGAASPRRRFAVVGARGSRGGPVGLLRGSDGRRACVEGSGRCVGYSVRRPPGAVVASRSHSRGVPPALPVPLLHGRRGVSGAGGGFGDGDVGSERLVGRRGAAGLVRGVAPVRRRFGRRGGGGRERLDGELCRLGARARRVEDGLLEGMRRGEGGADDAVSFSRVFSVVAGRVLADCVEAEGKKI